jgi:hypothetical protein
MEQNAVAVAVAAAFDISKYELADTAVLTFKDKDGARTISSARTARIPAQVRVYSPGSAEGIAAMAKASKATQMRMARLMSGQEAPEDDAEPPTASTSRSSRIHRRIHQFSGEGGRFLLEPRLVYLHKQVEGFIGKYANF